MVDITITALDKSRNSGIIIVSVCGESEIALTIIDVSNSSNTIHNCTAYAMFIFIIYHYFNAV